MARSALNATTLSLVTLLFLLSANYSHAVADQQFEISSDAYLDKVFTGDVPKSRVIWLKGTIKDQVRQILGHDYPGLRIRYWLRDDRVAWILNEIGKERPITAGFVVSEDRLENATVLAFRESRGWEIRHDSFTRQFDGAELDATTYRLDTDIDGISGATLSVNAMRRMATMALYLTTQLDTGET